MGTNTWDGGEAYDSRSVEYGRGEMAEEIIKFLQAANRKELKLMKARGMMSVPSFKGFYANIIEEIKSKFLNQKL